MIAIGESTMIETKTTTIRTISTKTIPMAVKQK
jgi:hypothetical protein